jgi:putative mRNA 3-end processing factor
VRTSIESKYLKNIEILPRGAILVGKNIVVDGHAKRPVRVITHIHADHIVDLDKSIRECSEIVATGITLDLLEALNYVDSRLLTVFRAKRRAVGYHECRLYNSEEVCLIPVDHIPGAAQVSVEIRDEKIKVGYTGDFKLTPKTEIMKGLDVLIIEATYGHPVYRRPFKDSINSLLVDFISEGLKTYKKVYIYAYHGKIQEVMLTLREHGVQAPYVVPNRVFEALKLLEERYNFSIGSYYKDSEAARIRSSEGVVFFKHFNSARFRKLDGKALHIVLTGRVLAEEPFKKLDDYTYVITLSDHGDFDDLVNYVIKADPRLVVIDGSRGGFAESLKEHLVERGFNAIVLPEGR